MEKRRLVYGVVVLLLVGLAERAAADPVSIDFRVTVSTAHGDLETFFGAPIRIGDVLQGTLRYDAAGVPDAPDPLIGHYTVPGELSFGAPVSLTFPLTPISVVDGRFDSPDGHDRFESSGSIPAIPGFEFVEASLVLESNVGGGGSGLPRGTADLVRRFGSGSFTFLAFRSGDTSEDPSHVVVGPAALIGAAQTPEPATLLLLAPGACALMIHRRQRRRTA